VAERILIVDDDPAQRHRLETIVANLGYAPVVVASGDAALALLIDPEQADIDCVVLDLVMPDLDGLGVLARMRQAGLAIPVIVQAAASGIDNVLCAIRAGAADFMVKPVGIERLHVALRNALANRALIGELSRARCGGDTLALKDIVARSPRMRTVLRTAEKAAASRFPVLIKGEPGVGKTLIARAIHGSGERRAKPFVAVDCAAMSHALADSVLFGHARGAVPGAAQRHRGKLVEAAGGTLFLDELGELPPGTQSKLFRAIEGGKVEPLGARKPVKIDIRLISATSRDLVAETTAGRFREDLLYRLQAFPIALPPLRDRPEDIPDLVRRFLLRFAAEEGRRAPTISAEALDMLIAFPWPGNVRQLENAIYRAMALADGDELGVGDFLQFVKKMAIPNGAAETVGGATCDLAGPQAETIVPIVPETWTSAPATLLPLLAEDGQIRSLAEIEADVIRFAINHYRRQVSEVARKLGIGRATLYRKLDTLGMRFNDVNDHRACLLGDRSKKKRCRIRDHETKGQAWNKSLG
jgi:DNA-binding NtrC family response regulator